jgi:hypothetical protein
MNNAKTKYVVNRMDNNNEPKEIEIMGNKFDNVESFKYLGSLVTDLNGMEIEIKSRLAAGNKSYHALGPILKKRSISQSIKICLYKTVITPTVMYGAEEWTLTNKMEKNANDMGKKDIEKNIWPNMQEWTLEN